jgi:hypothetical protein
VKDPDLADPQSDRVWTRIEDYLAPWFLRVRHRRESRLKPRTEPEEPRFLLSTLPFLLLFAGLAVMAIAIALAAFPGTQPPSKPAPPAQREIGTAPKGWFQEAQKEFHH